MILRKELICLCSLASSVAYSQNVSIRNYTSQDTIRVNQLLSISKSNFSKAPDSAIIYAVKAKELAVSVNYQEGVAYALKNIGIAYYYQGKDIEALDFWKQSLEIFKSIKDEIGTANILNNIGAIYFNQKDLTNALEYYLQSLKLAEKTKDKLRILSALNNIGGVYFEKPATHDKALVYFLKALPLSAELNDTESFGTTAANLGEIYYVRNDDSLALVYFNKSAKAFNDSENSPYAYNNLGKVYDRQKKYDLAILYHKKALGIARKLNGSLDIVQSLMGLAKTNISKKNWKEALTYLKEAEQIATKHQYSGELKNVFESFSFVYNQISDYKNAYTYQYKYAAIKDTLYNIETDKKLGTLQFDFEIQKKQSEVDLLTKDNQLQQENIKRQKFAKNAFLAGLFLILMIALILYRNYRRKVKINKLLDKQKDEIEGLLLNILPAEVAKELQTTGEAEPKHYNEVSVLFSDFKGFTAHAEKLSPQELVQELNACFVAFDEIIGKYNLEKIKTIGDAYMCAGGIPIEREGHVQSMVKASLEMQNWIRANNEKRLNNGLPAWDLRIGIHVGPLVAGVVGKKKYAYDIWGSTVNIASRMESNGEPGRVNISSAVYESIKSDYNCSYRGKIYAKNVGEIDMYFIDELRNN
ncbi:MAG TPA: adenylate/guanylate cyclase domain-containing protein [Chitinophagaceae bacterium]|nr:adenylate/guanylate cyclase domain-containing protein [Chitinophagaceae bacterium]